MSNYCPARCTYCGFSANLRIARHKLTPVELDAELSALKDLGIEEILLLTGDRAAVADYSYVRDSVRLAAARFPNVAVEVFPMSVDEYRGLSAAGCTAVTIYQETYDPVRYAQSHLSGPKRDYHGRLDAPARALAGGIRVVGLGALLGLGEPLFDLLSLFQHATHLRRMFWKGGVAISLSLIHICLLVEISSLVSRKQPDPDTLQRFAHLIAGHLGSSRTEIRVPILGARGIAGPAEDGRSPFVVFSRRVAVRGVDYGEFSVYIPVSYTHLDVYKRQGMS